VVREVGVHDDHEVAGCELQAVDVGGPETELASARLQVNVWGVDFGELIGNYFGSIGGVVVDDYELPVEVAAGRGELLVMCSGEGGESSGIM
jgi:hypothetical protein